MGRSEHPCIDMIPEMPALIPSSQQMNLTFYKPGEGNNELGNQIRLVETLKQVLFLEENKLEKMMNQTTNLTFQDLARQIRISSPTAINRSFDETIKCKSLEMNNERMLAILNKNKLEEFRKFWSFDGKLEKERKDNNIIMEDLVVEEVTHYRAGQNL